MSAAAFMVRQARHERHRLLPSSSFGFVWLVLNKVTWLITNGIVPAIDSARSATH